MISMKVLVVLISFHFVTDVTATYSGTLAFLQAGTDISVMNIWENHALTDTTSLYRHLLPVRLLLNDTHFRSPLIEKWDELEIIRATLTFYNVEKEFMGEYVFQCNSSGEMDVNFLHTSYVESTNKLIVDTHFDFGPPVYIHKSGDEAFFSFMAINMAANLSSLSGNQFIISANADFNYLTALDGKAGYINCKSIPVSDNYIFILSVFECTYYCLTVPECSYYGIFTMKNSSSHQTHHICVPLPGNPAYVKTECTSLCGGDGACGREYVDNIPALATADVYSMVPVVSEQINDMKDSSITFVNEQFYIDKYSSVELYDRVYIRRIKVSGSGFYNVLLFNDTCETLFDLGVEDDEEMYLGYPTGHVKVFEAEIAYTIAPVLARCLYFNSTKNLENRILKVGIVTNQFVLAEYMTVNAEWNKAECGDLEVMSRRNVIPDSAVDIHQFARDSLDFANGSVYPVPAVSDGVVEIHLHDHFESWIESLSIQASVKANVIIKVRTEKDCSNQLTTGADYMSIKGKVEKTIPAKTLTTETFFLLKRSGFTTFCGENITIKISAFDPYAVAEFTFALQLYGCVLYNGQSSANCSTQNLFETYEASADGWFEPRPIFAFNALRPGGGGLMLGDISADVYITVRLTQAAQIAVRKVILSGSMFSASVDVDGLVKFGAAYNTYPIEIEFTNARGNSVRIFDIQRDYSVELTFLNISVEIYACVILLDPQKTTSQAVNVTDYTTISTDGSEDGISTDGSGDGLISDDVIHRSNYNRQTFHAYYATRTYYFLDVDRDESEARNDNSVKEIEPATMTPTTVDNSVTSTTQQPIVNPVTQATQPGDNSATSTTSTQRPNNNPVASTTGGQVSHTTQNQVTTTIQVQINPNTQSQVNPTTQGQITTTTQSQVTTTSPGHGIPNTQGQGNPTTQGQITTTTQGQVTTTSVNQATRQPSGNVNTEATPSKKCTCFNQTRNITSEELDIIVQEIIANLTVPATETSTYKRTKMSMPDERKSSAVIGAVGIASMVTMTGVVVAMDAAHILSAYNFVKSLLCKN